VLPFLKQCYLLVLEGRYYSRSPRFYSSLVLGLHYDGTVLVLSIVLEQVCLLLRFEFSLEFQ
jgi:hypothetical protein